MNRTHCETIWEMRADATDVLIKRKRLLVRAKKKSGHEERPAIVIGEQKDRDD